MENGTCQYKKLYFFGTLWIKCPLPFPFICNHPIIVPNLQTWTHHFLPESSSSSQWALYPTPLLYSLMSLFWCLWDESFFLVGSVKFLTVFDPLNFHINVAYSFNKLLLPASLENSLPPHPFQIQLPSKFRPRSWLCYQMPICSWVNHMTASGFIFLTALYLPGRVAELIKWDKGVRVLLRAQNNKSDLGRAKHNNLSVIYNQHTVQTISSSVFSTLPQSLSPKLQALLCKALFSVGFIGTMG